MLRVTFIVLGLFLGWTGFFQISESQACPPGFTAVVNACVTPGRMDSKEDPYTIADFQDDCRDANKFNGDHGNPTDNLACVGKDGTAGCFKGESCWECCAPDGL